MPFNSDTTKELPDRQKKLNYILKNQDINSKLQKCQNSKDLVEFLNKTNNVIDMMRCKSPPQM